MKLIRYSSQRQGHKPVDCPLCPTEDVQSCEESCTTIYYTKKQCTNKFYKKSR